MRTGLIAEKIGMSRVFDAEGVHTPVTLLKVDGCQVVAVRSEEKHGYSAVQLGAGKVNPKNVSKPLRGHFSKAGIEPKRKLVEFRVDAANALNIGDELQADHFVVGQLVDVTGTSIGKGFAGVMKRHNFGGGRASHGNSLAHRTPGSTGQCQDPGRVFKNKKMPGQMGNVRVTKHNLEIVGVDNEKGLILVKGSVPGSKGTFVRIRDAVKRQNKVELPTPGSIKAAAAKAAPVKDESKDNQASTEESK